MEAQEVKVTEEVIESPKPQKFYMAFWRFGGSEWFPQGAISSEKEPLEAGIAHWEKTAAGGNEYKMISFEI